VVAIEGASGAGKSTVAARVAAATGAHLVAEAYERLAPRPSLRYRNPRELAALEHRLLREETRRYVASRATARSGALVVADTGFVGPLTYTYGLTELGEAPPALLDGLVRAAARSADRGQWGFPDLIVYLTSTARDRGRRMRADPEGHPPETRSRHEAVGRLEYRLYRDRWAPAFGPRLRFVDAAGPPDRVVARVLQVIRRRDPHVPPPPRPSAILRALHGVEARVVERSRAGGRRRGNTSGNR
jgi:AAA domain